MHMPSTHKNLAKHQIIVFIIVCRYSIYIYIYIYYTYYMYIIYFVLYNMMPGVDELGLNQSYTSIK
jgi:hypothetical protein